MITSSPFLFFRANLVTRLYFMGSVLSGYGVVLYEFFPQNLLIFPSSMYYFLVPSMITMSFVTLSPRLLQKISASDDVAKNSFDYATTDDIPSAGLVSQTLQNDMESSEPTASMDSIQEQQVQLQEVSMSESLNTAEPSPLPIDNLQMQEIIEKKIEPMGEEVSKIKADTTLLKDDMNALKSSIDDVFSKFEDTMIDLKSLQSSITNPLNYMQKKISPDEIHNVLQRLSSHEQPPAISHSDERSSSVSDHYTHKINAPVEDLISGTEKHLELQAFKGLFDSKLPLGKLMSIVSLVKELKQTLGGDSVAILTEQCKLMGLRQEIADAIQNSVKMLDSSNLPVNETLILMYRFAQIVGINDKEADRIYIKLVSDNSDKREHALHELAKSTF